MSNIPLVRRSHEGAALAHNSNSNGVGLDTSPEEDSQWSPAAFQKAGSALKTLNRMAKRPPVHLMFEDVGFTVSSGTGERRILQDVSGEFRSGELACILGPSGAGKSTLLNILAGYTSIGVNGRIMVNGHARDMGVFKKLSSYIMQDDLLQPWLTVNESMMIAADLKLGEELGKAGKALVVEEILQTIGLWEHRNTMSQRLSGGQTKRLSIALELVNNPPIIFLDEPTTGLDIVSIHQMVVLLRFLSGQGRTIICTIHQPSASLFTLFDQVYVLSRGLCCYRGSTDLLVPFLSECGHVCPKTYNPADFVLEILVGDLEAGVQISELCQNGKLCRKNFDNKTVSALKPVLHLEESMQGILVDHVAKEQTQIIEFPTTFTTQFLILIKRIFTQSWRNSLGLWIQVFHHISSAILLGGIFARVGNDGALPMVNFKFCMSVLVFFMYTYLMTPVLLFPMEMRLLRREYFNRWYSLKAYYAALTLSTLPRMIILGTLFLVITYSMSGQLLELDRFILFSFSSLLIAICSEGFGLLIGTTFNVTNGSIVGPATAAPLLALCCYGMGFGPHIEGFMKFLMKLSYLRYGLTGLLLALYHKRSVLECNADFCLYADTRLFLRDLDMSNDNYWSQMAGLLVITVMYRVVTYFMLRYRLTTEYTSKFMTYISKFLKYR